MNSFSLYQVYWVKKKMSSLGGRDDICFIWSENVHCQGGMFYRVLGTSDGEQAAHTVSTEILTL